MSKLKLEDAERLVQEVITEKGEDFVYEAPRTDPERAEACVNWVIENEERVPSCLVGQVLAKLDVLDEFPDEFESASAAETCQEYFEPEAVAYLIFVQTQQDSGIRYGDLPTTYTDTFTD